MTAPHEPLEPRTTELLSDLRVSLEGRLTRLETRLDGLTQLNLEQRLTQLETRVEDLVKKDVLERVRSDVKQLRTVGLTVASVATIVAIGISIALRFL